MTHSAAKIVLAIATMLIGTFASAQDSKPRHKAKISHQQDTTVYATVDKAAEFPGGEEEMKKFISSHKELPKEFIEREVDCWGRVLVGFIVETDGSLTDIKVIRNLDRDLDKQAMSIVKAMPRWTPAEINGRPVRSSQSVSVIYMIR